MKSYGGIWQKIISMDNLYEAWRRVRRGHAGSVAVQEFEQNLTANLVKLHTELAEGTYRPGKYRQFGVYDPKPRTISCAPVVDRVVHHALCGIITPLLERRFVSVSFACRKGYGMHAACALARRYAGRAGYFVKMDVRHYFDTISHDRLLAVVLPMFREEKLKDLIAKIVRHPVPGQEAGMGLPIGNLTSQWFANAFLDGFDHDALSGLGGCAPIGYLRYMDDFVFFAGTKAECWRLHDAAKSWLIEKRGLTIKDAATVVAPVSEGVPFLGLRIWPNSWRLQRSRFMRSRRTFAKRCQEYATGVIGEARFAQCAASSEGALRWFGFKNILKDNLATGEGSSSGSNRVKRGGSWNNSASNCTSSNRNNNNPSNSNNNNGFRLSSTLVSGYNDNTRSHPDMPALYFGGDEHALTQLVSSISEHHAVKLNYGNFTSEGVKT